MPLQEFAGLKDDANIYKLVGPVLLKQERTEAVMAVDGRLEFIENETYEADSLPHNYLHLCRALDAQVTYYLTGSESRSKLRASKNEPSRRKWRYDSSTFNLTSIYHANYLKDNTAAK